MANTQLPKQLYQVYEVSDVSDQFAYQDSDLLLETYDLATAHGFAYEQWILEPTAAFTIIQPYDGACRGFYSPSNVEE